MSIAKELICRYFHQLIDGCGNNECSNAYCRSSPAFMYESTTFTDRNRAAAEAIRLSQEKARLCFDEKTKTTDVHKQEINNLTEHSLQKIIDQSKQSQNFSSLQDAITTTFSNQQNLSCSFLREEFLKDFSVREVSPTASATPKCVIKTDPRIRLDNDDITLNFDAMRRSIKLFKPYDDEISSVMYKSIDCLLRQLNNDLKSKTADYENDANFLNIFFIIFELPCLSDPAFIFDNAKLFYSILTNLSIEAQAKFVRVLAKHTINLRPYISHLHQYITLHTFVWSNHTIHDADDEELLSSKSGMKEGLNVLRMLFYANLLNSKRDSSETIDQERENLKTVKRKLIQSRQRRIGADDDDDNDDDNNTNDIVNNEHNTRPSQNEHETSTDTDSSTAAASLTTRRRAPRTAMRTSSNDSDKISSPYENALQITLGLRPDEYREGLHSFNDFVNEYANEIIDIKKEYLNFIQQPHAVEFSFIFYPFFLSTMNKIALLNIESKARMYLQRRSILVHNIFSPIRLNPFFKIYVRRTHLIEDALISLEYQGIEQPEELRKQLFVEFEGEQGHDEGGLSKEFFQLITEQIFSPEYGMTDLTAIGVFHQNRTLRLGGRAKFRIVDLLISQFLWDNLKPCRINLVDFAVRQNKASQ